MYSTYPLKEFHLTNSDNGQAGHNERIVIPPIFFAAVLSFVLPHLRGTGALVALALLYGASTGVIMPFINTLIFWSLNEVRMGSVLTIVLLMPFFLFLTHVLRIDDDGCCGTPLCVLFILRSGEGNTEERRICLWCLVDLLSRIVIIHRTNETKLWTLPSNSGWPNHAARLGRKKDNTMITHLMICDARPRRDQCFCFASARSPINDQIRFSL